MTTLFANTNYLLYSLTFQVMDLVLWFKEYADENPGKKNKSSWFPKEVISDVWQAGTVINIIFLKGFVIFNPNIGV